MTRADVRDEEFEAVFWGLRNLLRECEGLTAPFSPKTLINDYLTRCKAWGDFDFPLFLWSCETYFGIPRRHDAWREFLGLDYLYTQEWEDRVGRQLTFEKLARFIIENGPPVLASPTALLGCPGKKARIFCTVESVGLGCAPTVAPFGPSTRITDRFVGDDLDLFWRRVRWRTLNRLPPLGRTVRSRFCSFLGWGALAVALSAVAAAILMSWDESLVNWFTGTVVAALIAGAVALCGVILVGLVSPWVRRLDQGLPAGIRTFRDLVCQVEPM